MERTVEVTEDRAILTTERIRVTAQRVQNVQILNKPTDREYLILAVDALSTDLATGLVYVAPGVSEHGEKSSVIGAAPTPQGASVLVPIPTRDFFGVVTRARWHGVAEQRCRLRHSGLQLHAGHRAAQHRATAGSREYRSASYPTGISLTGTSRPVEIPLRIGIDCSKVQGNMLNYYRYRDGTFARVFAEVREI